MEPKTWISKEDGHVDRITVYQIGKSKIAEVETEYDEEFLKRSKKSKNNSQKDNSDEE